MMCTAQPSGGSSSMIGVAVDALARVTKSLAWAQTKITGNHGEPRTTEPRQRRPLKSDSAYLLRRREAYRSTSQSPLVNNQIVNTGASGVFASDDQKKQRTCLVMMACLSSEDDLR